MIQAADVRRVYGRADRQVDALRGVDVTIASGEHVAILGRSGSGKSTLLNLIAGLDRPTTGSLSVDGKQLDQLTRVEMAEYRCRTVGMVFQAFQLIPQRTALQNVELPLILRGESRRTRRATAEAWLERVGLAHRAHHAPYELSGGEQQRVAIARALIHQPRVVLADEPTGNLDSVTAGDIEHLLRRLCLETSVTFVLVTHNQELARRMSDRIFWMADGTLSEEGPAP